MMALGTTLAIALGSALLGGATVDLGKRHWSKYKSGTNITPTANTASPVGNTYRGLGSSLFNAENVASEDWLRAEQSAQNAFARESSFNALEAEKNRRWQENMSKSQYQRAVEDMKLAGINPVLAIDQGGNAIQGGSSATASGYAGNSNNQKGSNDALYGILNLFAGLYSAGASNATRIKVANILKK